MKKGLRGINPASKPSGDGCVECLASPKGWWFHLCRCAECGHIGCCDSSPSQHASKHAAAMNYIVDDLDTLLDRLKQEGVKIDAKRMDESYGRFA